MKRLTMMRLSRGESWSSASVMRPGADLVVMEFHDVLFRRGILVAQEILKFIAGGVVAADGHVEGLVGPGKMRFHALDRGQGDAEGLGDAMTVFIGDGAVGILDEAGAHAAQVEEKPFLRCGGADPDDRRIA